MRFSTLLALSLLLLPTLSLAANPAVKSESEQTIIVTLPPLSGLVAMLLPEIKAQCLLPASADPHHFQPSPKQVNLLNQGNLLIRASRDDLGWPIRTDKSEVLDLWPAQAHGWLEFNAVTRALPQLAKSLIQQFPAHEEQINTRLHIALTEVKQLQKEWQTSLARIRGKGVFMQHPAWQGLLESNQVPIWEILESHQHGHEHGPRHLEEALANFEQHPGAILLGSKRDSNRSLEWLNSHEQGNHPIIKLDALGSCNMPWPELMAANLKLLNEQL